MTRDKSPQDGLQEKPDGDPSIGGYTEAALAAEPEQSDIVLSDSDDIEPEILERIEQSGIDPSDPNVRKLISVFSAYQGPLPPPRMLAQYEEVRPGSTNEIFEIFMKQSDHRRSIEKSQVLASDTRQNPAQFFGFSVAIFSIISASLLTYLVPDVWIVPSIIVIAGVGGPSAATVLSRLIVERSWAPPRDGKD